MHKRLGRPISLNILCQFLFKMIFSFFTVLIFPIYKDVLRFL